MSFHTRSIVLGRHMTLCGMSYSIPSIVSEIHKTDYVLCISDSMYGFQGVKY